MMNTFKGTGIVCIWSGVDQISRKNISTLHTSLRNYDYFHVHTLSD